MSGACDSGAYEWIGCGLAEIEDETYSGGFAAQLACHTITIGPGVVVGGGSGSAGLGATAGYLVSLRNGVQVLENGALTLSINPDFLPK